MDRAASFYLVGCGFDSYQGRVNWTHSSVCMAENCVEVMYMDTVGVAIIRNSAKHHVKLGFSDDRWQEFIDGVKAGEFDPVG